MKHSLSPLRLTHKPKRSPEFIHGVLQTHHRDGEFRSLADLRGKVMLSDIKAVSGWYHSCHLGFILPTVVTSKGTFNLTKFDDYAKACRHMSLPRPSKLRQFYANEWSSQSWEQFGGEVEIIPEPERKFKEPEQRKLPDPPMPWWKWWVPA